MEKLRDFFLWIVHGFKLNFILEMSTKEIVVAVIDVLLMTMLLFLLIMFLRDRRAGRLVIGLAVLFVAYLLCGFFNVALSYEVLGWLFGVGSISLIVLFQPEIRDMLEKIGTSTTQFVQRSMQKNQSADSELVTVLAETASDLARDQVGALIVVERTTKLGDVTMTGTELDAKATVKLLRNIFYKGSPLHDGAVVIQNGRIAAAGCMLPSAKSKEDYGEMGTRHRAGIGISEVSDAVVIIVSEETGIISVANNGVIKRNYNKHTLAIDLSLMLNGMELDEIGGDVAKSDKDDKEEDAAVGTPDERNGDSADRA